jgi:2,3-bisphosphoglycerate-independent phosphoglycerate mutase
VPPAPVILIIRDGWGENPNPEHDPFNAVKLARTPVDARLRREWPWTLIRTSGEDVGLPAGTMGNSEVGHQNIGAGRIVDQEIMRITRTIRAGTFFSNPALAGAFDHAEQTGGNVHIMGLVSDGQVHADLEHLLALIDLAARRAFPGKRLFVHAFTDGRDTGPRTGLGFIRRIEEKLGATGAGRIGSVIGRYYAMDRDHRWERIAPAYQCLTGAPVRHTHLEESASRPREAPSAAAAVEAYYRAPSEPSRDGDEFIRPVQIVDPSTGRPLPRIADGDSVIFFNFRGDRPRELTRAFVLDDAAWSNVTGAMPPSSGLAGGGFQRGRRLANLYFCTMTGYEAGLPVSAVAFQKPPRMAGILGEVVSKAGLGQFRCAETEKFPHVTYFFNDYREEPFDGERRELIPSPRDVATYDQKPEMSAAGVCDAVLRRLAAPDCEPLIIVNFANPDMVGHTGQLAAVIRACEVVDECVGRIVDAALRRPSAAPGARPAAIIITADHGNAEQMWDPRNDCPHTAHTTFDVPLIAVSPGVRGGRFRPGGRLADVAPTILAMIGLPLPAAMTGRSLLDAARSPAAAAAARSANAS